MSIGINFGEISITNIFSSNLSFSLVVIFSYIGLNAPKDSLGLWFVFTDILAANAT